MKLALAEAKKGQGKTRPNPCVGAVLVRGSRLLAKGFHRKAGEPHAEIEALRKVKDPRGATLYVTLEPCCHQNKRTPPCVDTLLGAGLRKVIVGTRDPNPSVRGKGVRRLRAGGIQVSVGIEKEACRALNPDYHHHWETGYPRVILKAATSMDGRVAYPDHRRWITSPAARRRGHELRSRVDGILVGMGTVQKDNPRLDARLGRGVPQPTRLVWDPDLTISPSARILSPGIGGESWILTAPKKINTAKAKGLRARGITLIPCPRASRKKIPCKRVLGLLGRRGLHSLLLEGGPGLWTQFLSQGAVDEIWHFMAPRLLGAGSKAWVGPLGRLSPSPWKLSHWEKLGPDLLLQWRLP